MNKSQIILTLAFFLVVCQFLPAQGPSPYPPTNIQPIFIGPQYQGQPTVQGQPMIQGQPTFQQGAQPGVIYPPGSTVVPLPSQAPGSIFGPPAAPRLPNGTVPGPPTAGLAPGTMVEPLPSPPGSQSVVVGPPGSPAFAPGPPGVPPMTGGPPNPIMVPVVDENLTWDQISDVIDDYFKISREQRVRRTGEAWTEGRIETAPLTGATVLEPFRHDSVGSFNRWESTFQSIRRRATVRVIPDPNGYLVEVIVLKELEDLPKPERSRIGPASYANDQQLPSQRIEGIVRVGSSPRWIPQGRDPALEQRILADIHSRLNGITVPR